MTDIFDRRTGEWRFRTPEIILPSEEKLEELNREEFNERVRQLRAIFKNRGLDGAMSVLAGEAVVVVQLPEGHPPTPEA